MMIGIPVIKKKGFDYFFDPRSLVEKRLLIKNTNGKTLLFQGYLDEEITMKKMIKYINEGMYKLLNRGR